MSEFLPETQQQQSGVQLVAAQPSDADLELARRVFTAAFKRPDLIPQEFIAYLIDFVQVNNLLIPISQVVGFAQFVVQTAAVLTSETTSSATYTDITTVGPEIDGLPDGQYALLYGVTMSDNGAPVYYSPRVNATEAVDADALTASPTTTEFGGMMACLKTLNNGGNNTLKMRYRCTSGNFATFKNRWLLAFRYANL